MASLGDALSRYWPSSYSRLTSSCTFLSTLALAPGARAQLKWSPEGDSQRNAAFAWEKPVNNLLRPETLFVTALLAWSFLLSGPSALAHDIITTNLTYARDISRIFNTRCVSCHATGSSVPLSSYQEVRPWAVSIKEQVLSRKMPPWGAVKGFGEFSPDLGLTQEEMTIIAAWVVGGAPEGDPAALAKEGSRMSHGAATVTLKDAVQVRTSATLPAPVEAAGIKPLNDGSVASARLIARLPDGRVLPLLWLYDYDGKSGRNFRFRVPLQLPAGTVVESSCPLSFAIETR